MDYGNILSRWRHRKIHRGSSLVINMYVLMIDISRQDGIFFLISLTFYIGLRSCYGGNNDNENIAATTDDGDNNGD